MTPLLGCAREFDRFSVTETSQLPFCSFARSRAAFDLSRVAPRQSDLLIPLRSYPNRRRVGPRAFFSLRSAACGLDTGSKTAGLRPSVSAPEALKLTRTRTLTIRVWTPPSSSRCRSGSLIVGKRCGCSRVSGLGVGVDARAIMESAGRVPIVQAACQASIVIGVVRSGTEPFAMIKIVSGNSRR